jgi:hypothetical protein
MDGPSDDGGEIHRQLRDAWTGSLQPYDYDAISLSTSRNCCGKAAAPLGKPLTGLEIFAPGLPPDA